MDRQLAAALNISSLTRTMRGVGLIGAMLLCGCTTTSLQPAAGTTALPQSALISGPDLQQVADLPPPPDTQNGTTQLIAANDQLTITVFQVSDLSRDVEVDPTGHITLPLIGSVQAAGKTLQQLQAEVTRLYGSRYLQQPDVTIAMKDSAGQRVTVDGEVTKAGIYPTSTQSSLIQVVAQAGGLTQIADANKIFVFRNYGNHRLVAQYSVDAIRQGKRSDPRVYGGDVVIVFASGTAIAMDNLKSALGLASSAVTLRGL